MVVKIHVDYLAVVGEPPRSVSYFGRASPRFRFRLPLFLLALVAIVVHQEAKVEESSACFGYYSRWGGRPPSLSRPPSSHELNPQVVVLSLFCSRGRKGEGDGWY